MLIVCLKNQIQQFLITCLVKLGISGLISTSFFFFFFCDVCKLCLSSFCLFVVILTHYYVGKVYLDLDIEDEDSWRLTTSFSLFLSCDCIVYFIRHPIIFMQIV